MSTQTNKLGLFKYDPIIDKEELFDIQEALNDNWDKIDNSIKNADWNQNDESAPDFVKNKPVVFESSDTLTWDGNTDGRTMVDVDDGVYMVHVSNSVPTLADFANGGSCTQSYPGGSGNIPFSSDIAMDAGGGCIVASTVFFCVAPEDNAEIEGIVFPEKGVYLMCVPSEGVCFTSITINGYAGFVTEKLDPAYLYQPDWNQNDESAPDFVKNRTHHDAWSANKFAQEIAFTTNDGATFGNFNQSLGLEAGKTYTILCDGDEYTGVAEAVDVFGTTAVRVGDFDAIGGTSETMSAPICVYDMREGGGVVFLKETFTEETSKFVVVLEGKNKEEYWSVALDPAESPLYNNMFVASWKPVPYSDFAHGFSAVLSIDGVEYSVNDADPKVFVTSTPDGYWTLHYDSIMVALCSESAIVFVNDTQAGLNNTPQVDMKKLTFNVPVFAPSMELKKLDSKYLPTPSWNDLKDKPVILEGGDTLTWDGNTEGLVCVNDQLYKVSDNIPSKSDLGEILVEFGDLGQETASVDNALIVTDDGCVFDAYFAVIPSDNYTVSVFGEDVQFLEKGIYFLKNTSGHLKYITIPGYTGFEQEKIAPEYIPDTVATKADIEAAIGIAIGGSY